MSTNRNPRKALCSISNHGPGKVTQWKASLSAHTISHRHIPPEPISYQVKSCEFVKESMKCTPTDIENSKNLNKIRKM